MPRALFLSLLLTGLSLLVPEGANAVSATCNGVTLEDASIVGIDTCLETPLPGQENQAEGSIAGDLVFNPMSTAFCLMRAAMGNAMFQVYCAVLDAVLPAFQAALALYVAIYSISVMLQITSGKDWAIRLVKVSLIYMLALNPAFFYEYMYKFFVIAVPDTLSAFLFEMDRSGTAFEDPSGAGSSFGDKRMGVIQNLDSMFNLIVGGGDTSSGLAGSGRVASYLAIAKALSWLIIGIPIAWLLTAGLTMALIAIMRVLVSYATTIIALSFTLMFAPVYFGFLLFSRTKILFDSWLRSLISYTLELALILFFLFLVGNVSVLTQELDPSVVRTDCLQSIKSLDFAKLITVSHTCFSMEIFCDIIQFLYGLVFFSLTYFMTAALMYGFMGKIGGIVQQLTKFGSPAATTPALTHGTGQGHLQHTTMEDAFMGIKGGFSGRSTPGK